jgi:tryptophan 2,3-dioxygenase
MAVLQIKLGLTSDRRLAYGDREYCSYLAADHSEYVQQLEKEPSLFDLVEQWLERTPFINLGEFDFWAHYTSSINAVMAQERHFVDQQSSLTQDQRAELHAEIDGREEHYESVVDEDKYEAKRANGDVRMSFKATKAALLISLYQVGGCCAGARGRCACGCFFTPLAHHSPQPPPP